MRLFPSDRYPLPLPEGHRFPAAKYRLLRERLEAHAAAGAVLEFIEPHAATDDELLRVHDRAYVGRVLSGTDHADRRSATAVLEALRRAGDHVDERVRRTARAVATGRTPRGRLRKPDLHDSAAALTVIRTGWGRDAVRVLVDYRDAVPRLEIAVADRLLVDGAWHWSAKLGGRPLEAEAGWTVACWESGRKAAHFPAQTNSPGNTKHMSKP